MKDFFFKNMFSILFALIALVFVILILVIGWKALWIAAVIAVAALLGRIKDNNASIKAFFTNMFKK